MTLQLRLPNHPRQPLFTPEELPQKHRETGPYITSTLDDILELAAQHDPSDQTQMLILSLANMASRPEITGRHERKNGYLVGLGHIRNDYRSPRPDGESLVFSHKENPDHRLNYLAADFNTCPERIRDFSRPGAERELLTYISETGHDGLHLWSPDPNHGLLRLGGTATFIENGYLTKGLLAAQKAGLKDKGGTGSDAAAKFAAATQRPAIYLRSPSHTHTYFLYFEPMMEEGMRGSQTHVVTLPGYTPPTGERQHVIQPMPGVIPIGNYRREEPRTPSLLYAA